MQAQFPSSRLSISHYQPLKYWLHIQTPPNRDDESVISIIYREGASVYSIKKKGSHIFLYNSVFCYLPYPFIAFSLSFSYLSYRAWHMAY